MAECNQRVSNYQTATKDGAIKIYKNYCLIHNNFCSACNCYFKQLQRLKAENERLKEQINDAENYIDELQDALRDMEVQKDNIKNLKPIDITEFCKTAESVFDNSNKYKTALEEIRKLTSKECEKCQKEELNEDYCIGSEFCTVAKINEVLADE